MKAESNKAINRYVDDDGPNKVVQESEQVEIDWVGALYRVFGSEGKPPTEYSVEGLCVLDVPRNKLCVCAEPPPPLLPLLKGEAMAFAQIWESLDV